MRILRWTLVLILATGSAVISLAQAPANVTPSGASLLVASSTETAAAAMQANSADWSDASLRKIALHRTPALFDTDEPGDAEITTAEVRCLRAGGKLYVQLSWRDTTRDAASLEAVPETAPETRFHKVPTDAEGRFFDAAAVMVPDNPGLPLNPSLQMGDAEHPVHIYYWNSTRGAMLMTASGRATTRRTGQSFTAGAAYQGSQWIVTFELPDQPAGVPLAFAIWNGSQKDRDGRKYFSVWYTLE
jgi:Ethylbenzene dehydrogenase